MTTLLTGEKEFGVDSLWLPQLFDVYKNELSWGLKIS